MHLLWRVQHFFFSTLLIAHANHQTSNVVVALSQCYGWFLRVRWIFSTHRAFQKKKEGPLTPNIDFRVTFRSLLIKLSQEQLNEMKCCVFILVPAWPRHITLQCSYSNLILTRQHSSRYKNPEVFFPNESPAASLHNFCVCAFGLILLLGLFFLL